MKQFRHEDYQVCWICPLDIEKTAAEAMLDERHLPLSNNPNDSNVYTLGRIGKHHVAIAGLSVGNSVTTANAANYMKFSFPAMRVILLVGIGGGAPSESKDIRLGDIVVSYPDGTYGGVVQIDSGKSVPTGVREDGFQLKGTLNQPPEQLLNVVKALQAKHLGLSKSEEPDFMVYLRKAIEDKPRLKAQYPGAGEDRLFKSTYDHVGSQSTCEACSIDQVVRRDPRHSTEPELHTGLIASANNVRKDGRTREKLMQEHNILCFEMEAAGIMNNFPCLVIRGISDYADSHKNDQWQPYAALVAAAYAKEWLSTFPEIKVSCLEPVTGMNQETQKKCAFSVPFEKDEHFVGREAFLGRIAELVEDTHHSPRVALVGLGGIGKSQIAIEYAHRLHARAPGTSVFWLNASNSTSFRTSYVSIATKLQLPGYSDPKIDQSEPVRQWLASEYNEPWFLIVDNIEDECLVDNELCLPQWLPQRSGSGILITSRNRDAAFHLVNHEDCVLSVGNMEATEAIELLDKKLTIGKRLTDKNLFAKELEYIPLAMTQATAYISRRTRTTITTYLSYLQGNQDDRLSLLTKDIKDPRRPDEIPNSVLKTWQISFNQISETCPLAAKLLSRMSMYDKQHIPESLLRTGMNESSLDFEDALEILLGYSFTSQERGKDHFNMHRLVQLATREWLQLNGRLVQEREAAVRTLAREYPSGEYENWQLCQTLEPHVQAVLEYEQHSSQAKVARAKLLFNRGWYFWLRGHYEEAEDTIRQSLEERLQCLSPLDTDIFSSIALQALILRYQGRYPEAEDMNRQALAGRQDLLAPDHPDILTSLENLALVLQGRSKFAEAEQMCRQALRGRERQLGFDHPDTLTSCNNLALVLKDSDKTAAAERMCRRALAGRECRLGFDHPDTLTSYNNLGVLLRYRGKFDEAEGMYRRALAGRERRLGSDHPETLKSCDNLGVLLRYRQIYDKAEEMCRRALTSRERRLGPDHPDTLTSLDNLAMVLHDQGNYVEAESQSRRATECRKKVLGPSHFGTLTSLSYLARTLRSQGRYSEAESYYRQILTGLEILGFAPDHSVRKKTAENLSLVLQDMENDVVVESVRQGVTLDRNIEP